MSYLVKSPVIKQKSDLQIYLYRKKIQINHIPVCIPLLVCKKSYIRQPSVRNVYEEENRRKPLSDLELIHPRPKTCSHSPEALSTLSPALEGLKAFNTTNTSALQMSSSHSLNPTKYVSHANRLPNILLKCTDWWQIMITNYLQVEPFWENHLAIKSKTFIYDIYAFGRSFHPKWLTLQIQISSCFPLRIKSTALPLLETSYIIW